MTLPSETCHFPEINCSCTVLLLSFLLPVWRDVLVSMCIYRRQYYALEDLQVVKDVCMKDPNKAPSQFWFCFDLYTLFPFIRLNCMVSSSQHYIHCLQYSKVIQGFRDFLATYLLLTYTIISNSGLSTLVNYEVLRENIISWKSFDLAEITCTSVQAWTVFWNVGNSCYCLMAILK